MKFQHLKMYGIALAGVFNAHGPFVDGQYMHLISASSTKTESPFLKNRGLEVEIEPRVSFTDDGAPIKPQSLGGKRLKLKLVIKNRPSTQNGHQSRQRRDVMKGVKAKVGNLIMKEHCDLKEHFAYGKYCTVWTISWKSLKKLVKSKKLYPFPKTSLDPQVYIREHRGLYTFVGNHDDDPYLYFGKKNGELLPVNQWRSTPAFVAQRVDITFLKEIRRAQNLQFKFGNEATKVPPDVYKKIGETTGFELKLDNNGYYEVSCDPFFHSMLNRGSLDHLLDWSMRLDAEFSLSLSVSESYVNGNDGSCTLLFEDSGKENEWVLGSSLLKAYTVTAETKGERQVLVFIPSNGTPSFRSRAVVYEHR